MYKGLKILLFVIIFWLIFKISNKSVEESNKGVEGFKKRNIYSELLNNPNDVIFEYVHLPFENGYGSKYFIKHILLLVSRF
jgi:hypothetical protein